MSFTYSHHVYTSTITASNKNVHLITSWWLNQPKLKNMIVKMGSSSPGIGVDIKKKIFELPPPRKISQFYIYHLYKLPLGWLYITYHLFREPGNNHWPFIPSNPVTKTWQNFQGLPEGSPGRLGLDTRDSPTAKTCHPLHPTWRVGNLTDVFFLEGWCFMIKNKIQKERC